MTKKPIKPKPKKAAPVGRPDDYTPAKAKAICDYMMEGETLLTISTHEGMPSKSAMLRWLPKYAEFRDLYARAAEIRAGVFVEETIDITDNASNDWMEFNDGENKGWRANGENIQRARLRVDTRKWLASKLLPKMYGEKQTVSFVPDFSALNLEQTEQLIALMSKISAPKQG